MAVPSRNILCRSHHFDAMLKSSASVDLAFWSRSPPRGGLTTLRFCGSAQLDSNTDGAEAVRADSSKRWLASGVHDRDLWLTEGINEPD